MRLIYIVTIALMLTMGCDALVSSNPSEVYQYASFETSIDVKFKIDTTWVGIWIREYPGHLRKVYIIPQHEHFGAESEEAKDGHWGVMDSDNRLKIKIKSAWKVDTSDPQPCTYIFRTESYHEEFLSGVGVVDSCNATNTLEGEITLKRYNTQEHLYTGPRGQCCSCC